MRMILYHFHKDSHARSVTPNMAWPEHAAAFFSSPSSPVFLFLPISRFLTSIVGPIGNMPTDVQPALVPLFGGMLHGTIFVEYLIPRGVSCVWKFRIQDHKDTPWWRYIGLGICCGGAGKTLPLSTGSLNFRCLCFQIL